MAKNSSGDKRRMHPYIADGVDMYGSKDWKTSKIIRKNPKDPHSPVVEIKIKTINK